MTPRDGQIDAKVAAAPQDPAASIRLSRAQVEGAYRRYAPIYDRVFGAVLDPGRRALADTASELANGTPRSLLEIGVGTGLTLPLYSPSLRITGIDVCEDMLEKARERAAALHGRRIELRVADGESLDFPDESFDFVVLPYVLSVTPDPERLVAEVRRVCRKDGSILILNHFSGSRFWWLLERMVKPMAERVGFRSEFGLEDHVIRHDWQVVAVRDVNLFGLSKLVTIRNA